jgi:hypothetical protein
VVLSWSVFPDRLDDRLTAAGHTWVQQEVTMHPRPLTLILVALLPVAPRCSRAQQLPAVAVGERIRVHAPRAALKHARVTFTSWGDSTLVVHAADGNATIAVPFAEVERLERYGGKDRLRGTLRGAGIFGTVGMLAGIVIGKAAVDGCSGAFCEFDAMGYMLGGAILGGVVGAPIGATALAPDRWKRVSLPVELGFAPYRQSFFEGPAFRLLWAAGSAIVILAIS